MICSSNVLHFSTISLSEDVDLSDLSDDSFDKNALDENDFDLRSGELDPDPWSMELLIQLILNVSIIIDM
jgi:hypothetical protein